MTLEGKAIQLQVVLLFLFIKQHKYYTNLFLHMHDVECSLHVFNGFADAAKRAYIVVEPLLVLRIADCGQRSIYRSLTQKLKENYTVY